MEKGVSSSRLATTCMSLALCCLGACFMVAESTCWCVSAAACGKYLAAGNTGGVFPDTSDTSLGSRQAQPLSLFPTTSHNVLGIHPTWLTRSFCHRQCRTTMIGLSDDVLCKPGWRRGNKNVSD
ncbi:hypothetical protein LY78DRAFT_160944 [Colletotrichum sublineola]|nr:hypothetical protein LY78DRAFT_160944 [Colletotrichum sublineola]